MKGTVMNEVLSRAERAVDFFMQGYNCAQSVAAAFASDMDLTESRALTLFSPFGGGFGRLRQVCGAFSGMMPVIGHFFGYSELSDPGKAELYPRVQELAARFEKVCGSIVCADILKDQAEVGGTASPRTEAFYKTRPCARVVYHAATVLEEYLRQEGVL